MSYSISWYTIGTAIHNLLQTWQELNAMSTICGQKSYFLFLPDPGIEIRTYPLLKLNPISCPTSVFVNFDGYHHISTPSALGRVG